jgi:hypothetical protein
MQDRHVMVDSGFRQANTGIEPSAHQHDGQRPAAGIHTPLAGIHPSPFHLYGAAARRPEPLVRGPSNGAGNAAGQTCGGR